ncbi:MAG TPA: SMC-Scp complex subunit ScpB [Candidatus Nanoarchaeia archaeon]|nr:SMC-Scp complex subunit ScpB [Candidatus Nanoarchaeia archaeon]
MSELENAIEAILFVAEQPVELSRLAKAVEAKEVEVTTALASLENRLKDRGIVLLKTNHRYQLVTAPNLASVVERFIGQQFRAELSRPALETLAIIAYRQPVSRADVEAIRGVSSEQTMRSLLLRGLVAESGHSQTPGQAKLYRTTAKFLQVLGLTETDKLPPLDEQIEEL